MAIEHSILAVLSFWPSTGYDIKAEFEHKVAGLYWGMSYGSIYPKLRKLEEEGLIYTVEEEEGGRKKKQYELTPKGWKEFEKWLSVPPVYPVIKDELLMKISTWHEDMDDEILIDHLLKRKEVTEDLLEFVKDWPTNGTSYISDYGMLSIRYGEIRLEAELKWVEESIKALKTKHLPNGQDPNNNTEKLLARRRAAIHEKGENDE
jgi:PadR family transcriptional regulator, regulatory protein AphA